MTNVKCDNRHCLDNKKGYCLASQIEVMHGRCNSITRGKEAMRSDVGPMERNARGALANKQR